MGLRRASAAAVACLALCRTGAEAATSPPDANATALEKAFGDPDWLAEPSADERAKAYPVEALEKGKSGETTIVCTVKADGGLADCSLLRETPAGMGFGAAALSLAGRFRMKPGGAGGAARISIPIRWAMVAEPDWARTVSGDDLWRLYPKAAVTEGMSGKARVQCRVRIDGTLTDCFVVSESPEGWGFGQATVEATRYFRMKPETVDGKPVEGGVVIVPITWLVPGPALKSAPVFAIGDGAKLIAVMSPGERPKDGQMKLDCPSPTDKARKCVTHAMTWRDQPSSSTTRAVMARYGIKTADRPNTVLSCLVDDDARLKDCSPYGKVAADEEAAMRALIPGLVAASVTQDQVSTAHARVIVPFYWGRMLVVTKLPK